MYVCMYVCMYVRKEEKDMKFIPSFSLAYSSKVKQHKEIVQQLSTMV